jgi:hypothetical protein
MHVTFFWEMKQLEATVHTCDIDISVSVYHSSSGTSVGTQPGTADGHSSLLITVLGAVLTTSAW